MVLEAVLLLFLSALSADGTFDVTGPTVVSCGPSAGSRNLEVQWANVPGSDYYELQLLTNASSPEAYAIVSTGAARAVVQDVLPGRSYWVRLRAHKANSPSYGPGTWGPVGPVAECRSGLAALAGAFDQSFQEPSTKPQAPQTFWLEVFRESEYTYDIDYLSNHNSGNLLGDVAIITVTGYSNTSHPAPFFKNFTKATFTMYCVEVLSVKIPNTITTGGDDRFADYQSCNSDDPNDPSAPKCDCDSWIDRYFAKQDPDPYCHLQHGGPCSMETFLNTSNGCTCTCSKESLGWSAQHTGMMPAFFGSSVQLGNWYSHPKAGECAEHESVGKVREDGSQCTWKRRADARTFRGVDLMQAGWNSSNAGDEPRQSSADPSQFYQNAEVVRKVVASSPLQPWSCGFSAASATIMV
mmetsp:Transcript_87224/g.157107  ORF Transcript_87224/g.157107 Transcript_87224/m.157107 type:complete len:410 (-) Transcript_87224:230-1459(-)